MEDIRIWQALNPTYSIQEDRPLRPKDRYQMSPEQRQKQLLSLKEDGYCLIPSLIDEKKVKEMIDCIQVLKERGIPLVFCFVYDLFWELILEMDLVLSDFLTPEYLIIPNVWTWYVNHEQSAYFPPHRDVNDEDFIDEEGMPTLFSLWIPLTDVTTQHSCMYVLPASRDPDYPEEALHWRKRWKEFGHKPWDVEDLVNIRALPAPKGSFLAWNAGVLHWGSKPHPQASPRISIGYYFHSPKAKKKHSALIDLRQPLPFSRRLEVIWSMMHIYGNSLAVKKPVD